MAYRNARWPRNHPEVVPKLDDLARCITVMPTSGSHFTAQAPLFPVFLLGVLATVPKHKAVSSNWFDKVLQTPVRSVCFELLSIFAKRSLINLEIQMLARHYDNQERPPFARSTPTYLDLD